MMRFQAFYVQYRSRLLSTLSLILLPALSRAQETPDSSRVKSSLNRILSRQEFQPESTREGFLNRMARWLQEQWNRLQHLLQRLFGYRRMGANISFIGRPLVYTIVLLLALLLLAVVLRALMQWRKQATAEENTRSVFEEDEPEPLVIEPEPWLQEATARANAGDYRGAVRALFIAGLMQMDRAGLIRFERTRTNGDYLRAVRRQGARAVYEQLLSFTRGFERIWYGDAPANESDYRQAHVDYGELQARLQALPGPETMPQAIAMPVPTEGV